jgi:inward rectifier potassium channel
LNKDGSFNVKRKGLPFLQSINLYNSLLNMSWWRFYCSLIGVYISAITIFAFAYYLLGEQALTKTSGISHSDHFWASFFFSVHTITAVGYGHISPSGILANILVTIEAFVGLAGFAIAAALIFARFSKPKAKVLFSRMALISQYHDQPCFMFRIANGSRSELLEVEARVLMSLNHSSKGVRTKRFYELPLQRSKSAFFPVDWIVVHPITNDSPIYGLSQQHLLRQDAEFLLLINAIDDTFGQQIHVRSSYRCEEIVWGARYKDMYRQTTNDGKIAIDLNKLDDIEHMDTPKKGDQTIWDF